MENELIERFDTINSHGAILKKCFSMLANASPKMASEFLDCLEGMHEYNNYLSENEALAIVDKLVNSDGTVGPKWSPDTLFNKVDSFGYATEKKPYFNKWELYVAMNMEHSDHSAVLSKWADGDSTRYAEACFDLAVSQLSDVDRMHWIRDYFRI